MTINLENKTVFLTGVAGFIGSNLALHLFANVKGVKIIGIDNMNNYYDVRLKEERLAQVSEYENFTFIKGDIADPVVMVDIVGEGAGAFYFEVAERACIVEPYNYYNHDGRIIASGSMEELTAGHSLEETFLEADNEK